jgi:hypothetical protein
MAQVADVNSTDNNSIFTCNHYPATSGNEYKPGTYRIVPHTDESLITLLLTSPGALRPCPALSQLPKLAV